MLIAAALALIVVLVFGNAVMRYAFNSGLTVSEELSRWLFVWVTFLGAIVAMNDGAHGAGWSCAWRLGLCDDCGDVYFVGAVGLGRG